MTTRDKDLPITWSEPEKADMERVINECPTHLYTYSPEAGDTRYVFSDVPYTLRLGNAYLHAIHVKEGQPHV
jgi:hypothetical protein